MFSIYESERITPSSFIFFTSPHLHLFVFILPAYHLLLVHNLNHYITYTSTYTPHNKNNAGSVSEVTQLLSNLLRNWSYLEPLFMGSEEVQKELPIEANRFAEVNMEVKDILKVIIDTKSM